MMKSSDDENKHIISYLAEHPKAGVLMQGTGGVRKLRWAKEGGGKSGGVRVIYKFSSVDIKAVRHSVAMAQAEFASTFGISLGTLRHWERGDRAPRGPALVLLDVLANDPQAVIRALA